MAYLKLFRGMSLEGQFDYLERLVQVVHDRLELHEWHKDYRPWNAVDQVHPKEKKCKKTCRPGDHEVYFIQCTCGEIRPATQEEFDAAEEVYDGY